jgi:hypothetical protein
VAEWLSAPLTLALEAMTRRAQRTECQAKYHRETAMTDPVAEELSVEDILLLLAANADGPYDLDPIRVMKGAFIVSQAGRPTWRGQFNFRPYDYGPLDSRVYSVRDRLVTNRLLQADRSRRYETYHLTPEGKERVAELERRFGEDAEWVKRVGRYVTSKSFSSLLDEIYRRWPEFASKSVIKQ